MECTMASSANIGLNNDGRAAAESINVMIGAKLGKKLTFAQSFIEAEKIIRSALTREAVAESAVSAERDA